jgi:hypothetical protein
MSAKQQIIDLYHNKNARKVGLGVAVLIEIAVIALVLYKYPPFAKVWKCSGDKKCESSIQFLWKPKNNVTLDTFKSEAECKAVCK